jgi:hypothetical protein
MTRKLPELNATKGKQAMTKQEIHKLKMQVLGLNYDAIRKRTKASYLAKKLLEQVPSFRFTPADYRAFYRSRNLKLK